jgi:CBS domain-containing protein
MVKLAIRRSGEIGRNVTEEDVLAEMSVGDVMAAAEAIPEHEPLRAVLRRFAQTEHLVYPVVREDGDITGILKLETLKDVLPNRDAWDWLVAADVAEPPGTTAPRTSPLRDALDLMRDANWEQLLVTDENDRPIGILDRRVAQRRVKEEVLRRQHGAFAEGAAAV